jgi:hypothetical protein
MALVVVGEDGIVLKAVRLSFFIVCSTSSSTRIDTATPILLLFCGSLVGYEQGVYTMSFATLILMPPV